MQHKIFPIFQVNDLAVPNSTVRFSEWNVKLIGVSETVDHSLNTHTHNGLHPSCTNTCLLRMYVAFEFDSSVDSMEKHWIYCMQRWKKFQKVKRRTNTSATTTHTNLPCRRDRDRKKRNRQHNKNCRQSWCFWYWNQ